MPHCGQHAPHLPVAPFKDGQFDLRAAFVGGGRVFPRFRLSSRVGARGTHRPDCDAFRAARRAVFQHDAPAQPAQDVGRRHAAHFGPVRFGDMILGVGHLVQKVAVVGKKDQALAFRVQSPDRAQHGAGRQFHQIGH